MQIYDLQQITDTVLFKGNMFKVSFHVHIVVTDGDRRRFSPDNIIRDQSINQLHTIWSEKPKKSESHNCQTHINAVCKQMRLLNVLAEQ